MAYSSAKNASQDLSVLLRNGTHSGASIRFALKADTVSISYSKTPIQIPVPQRSPEIIDLGSFRPSISVNGTVDTVQPSPNSLTINGQTYYIPFKNWLENQVYDLRFSDSSPIEIEIGDTTYPQTDSSTKGYASNVINSPASLSSWTGGGVYRVSIQQCRFGLNAAREDRYDFSLQFVGEARQDWVDKGDLD